MTKRLCRILFVTLLAHAAAAKSEIVGWVLQCSGDWEDRTNNDDSAKLPCKGNRDDIWRPLSRESKLVLTARKPRQWINIRIARTGERHLFDCDRAGEC